MTFKIDCTNSADPWTDHGYAEWRPSAEQVRRQWLAMMGLSQREIDQDCKLDPPVDIDEELEQYNAMFDVNRLNEQNRAS